MRERRLQKGGKKRFLTFEQLHEKYKDRQQTPEKQQ